MKRAFPLARVRSVPVDDDGMNKSERAYSQDLDIRKTVGEIVGWWFHAISLKMANGARYTTDFLVQNIDGTVDLVDVKPGKRHKDTGEWTFWSEEAAKVRLKVTARLYPFRVLVAYRCGAKGPWKHEEIGG